MEESRQHKQKPGWKKERQRRNGKVKGQVVKTRTRAKYGPRMKPAPVIVKSLETGEVLKEIPPTTYRQRKEIARLRGHLGIKAQRVPLMSDEADRLLKWLRQREAKQRAEYEELRDETPISPWL